mmetsp:Transcript_7792/g.17419  ORF Transcript_7792/g.17419 Transcript_7792/m.17419 type:complete len:261 (-) Transcript_7792:159-941(-)
MGCAYHLTPGAFVADKFLEAAGFLCFLSLLGLMLKPASSPTMLRSQSDRPALTMEELTSLIVRTSFQHGLRPSNSHLGVVGPLVFSGAWASKKHAWLFLRGHLDNMGDPFWTGTSDGEKLLGRVWGSTALRIRHPGVVGLVSAAAAVDFAAAAAAAASASPSLGTLLASSPSASVASKPASVAAPSDPPLLQPGGACKLVVAPSASSALSFRSLLFFFGAFLTSNWSSFLLPFRIAVVSKCFLFKTSYISSSRVPGAIKY